MQWLRDNRPTLLEICKRSGVADDKLESMADEFIRALAERPPGSALDDPGATRILQGIIDRIEAACGKIAFPLRGGVVFGNSVGAGLIARQLPVLATDVSIIETTLPFLIFCDLVSKVIVHSLPEPRCDKGGSHFEFNAAEVRTRLQSERWILSQWVSILVRYAVFGTPPKDLGVAPQAARQYLRGKLLDAMEVFAIAHEYGHHSLSHGLTTSMGEECDLLADEHEADMFARGMSLVIGQSEGEFFLFSGAGGALILGAIELVSRTRAVLSTGTDDLPLSRTHPSVTDRIKLMDRQDLEHLPNETAEEYIGIRQAFSDVLKAVWAEAKPAVQSFHTEGLRPIDNVKSPTDWLPFISE